MPHTTCPNFRRIGILTGGGDCPGLNAVIRAVGKDAINCGIEVVGIEDGFLGLIEDRCRRLTFKDVSGILTQGGTILGSNNKSNPERHCVGHNPDGTPIHKNVIDDCFETIKTHKIEALVVIGGDGTMSGAVSFCRRGLPVVGVPKTIDNDIEGTELTFGFQTAVATATLALDQVQTTADSHHRAMVVEVMGRNAGWIALHAGIASGADVILIRRSPSTSRASSRESGSAARWGSARASCASRKGPSSRAGSRSWRGSFPAAPIRSAWEASASGSET
jgi:6-phosphofructokinase